MKTLLTVNSLVISTAIVLVGLYVGTHDGLNDLVCLPKLKASLDRCQSDRLLLEQQGDSLLQGCAEKQRIVDAVLERRISGNVAIEQLLAINQRNVSLQANMRRSVGHSDAERTMNQLLIYLEASGHSERAAIADEVRCEWDSASDLNSPKAYSGVQ